MSWFAPLEDAKRVGCISKHVSYARDVFQSVSRALVRLCKDYRPHKSRYAPPLSIPCSRAPYFRAVFNSWSSTCPPSYTVLFATRARVQTDEMCSQKCQVLTVGVLARAVADARRGLHRCRRFNLATLLRLSPMYPRTSRAHNDIILSPTF